MSGFSFDNEYQEGRKRKMRNTDIMIKLADYLCKENVITLEEKIKLHKKIKRGDAS